MIAPFLGRKYSLSVGDNTLNINTESTNVHGYSPAQIMLGFEPKHYHFDIKPVTLPTLDQAEEPLPEYHYQISSALGDEQRLLSSENASYTYHYHKQTQRKQHIPEAGDLVLVRNHSVGKQRDRKLEAKWLGPRILVEWIYHRHSGLVREMHGTGKLKRISC